MNYSLSQKPKSPRYPERGKVWIATPQSIATLNTKEFIKRVSDSTRMSESELNSALMNITRVLRECLREGYCVNIDDFGEFYVKFDCEPFEGETSVGYNSARQIKDVKSAWRPGHVMKSIMNQVGNKGLRKIEFNQVLTCKIKAAGLKAKLNCDKTVTLN